MDIVKVFANNVKKYRTERGLSQEAFAEKAGLHRTYISAIEREKRSIALDMSLIHIGRCRRTGTCRSRGEPKHQKNCQ